MRKCTSAMRLGSNWLLILAAAGCSGTPEGNTCDTNSVAGASSNACTGGASSVGGAATDGGATTSGGDSSTGGTESAGGTSTTGGSEATGGDTATGGDVSTGGTATGGDVSTGGTATGGDVSTGGTATGGDVSTGGTATGGDVSTGGTATGGDVSTGGTATGGDVSTGGTATGGDVSTGGAATGGDVSTGGAATGGTPATGGAATGGTPATGGAEATGGDVSTGGAATGGTPATGGSSSISPDDAFTAATKFPTIGSTTVPVDAWLSLTFDSPPTLGNSGHIYIRKVSDDSQADVINLADSPLTVKIASTYNNSASVAFRSCTATQSNLTDFAFNTTVNYIGYDGLAYPTHTTWKIRIVKYNPVRVVGNQLRIYPHDGMLAYNTQYYVTIDNNAVVGKLSGTAFAGVTNKTAWAFTTKAAAPATSLWTVNADGTSGDFMTIQGAINAVPPLNASTIKVTVANGIYEELLSNYTKNNLVINGSSRDGTIIQYENYEGFLPGTGGVTGTANTTTIYQTPLGDKVPVPIANTGTAPTLYEGGRSLYHLAASNTELNNITIKNTHVKTGTNDAAETLYFNVTTGPTTKFISRDSNWISSQDTLQLKGYSWFYNSLIAGDVDFIWGVPGVALFENCELRTRVDPTSASSGGYVVQSRAAAGSPGFIFLNSQFTAESGVLAASGYLARHNGTYPDSSIYSNCNVGPHIKPVAFSGTSGTASPTDVLGLRYYNFMNPDNSPWSTAGLPTTFYALTDTQNAKLYADRTTIYGGPSISDGAGNSYTSILWALTP